MNTFLFLLTNIILATADNAQIDEFYNGNRLFSRDVYNNLKVDNYGNIVFSPYSIESLLALIQSGANDATGEEIRKILHFPASQEDTENAMQYIVPSIQSELLGAVATLNRINVDASFTLKEDYKQKVKDIYQVNFGTVLKEEFFGTSAVSSKVTLINDVSLYGEWSIKFDYSATSRQPFYTRANSTVNVNMMSQTTENLYFESSDLDAKILTIELEEEGISLTVVLPNDVEGLSRLENQIEKVLTTNVSTKEVVEINLPRFTITSTVNFKGVLEDLGLEKVFDSSEADLSGIGGDKGDFLIGAIKQDIRFNVGESAIGGSATGEMDDYKTIVAIAASKSFNANHPFLFYLKVRNVIVFLGRVIEPRV